MELLERRPGAAIAVSLSIAAVAIASFVYFQGGFGEVSAAEEEKETTYTADKDPGQFIKESFEADCSQGADSQATYWECDATAAEDEEYGYSTSYLYLQVWIYPSARQARSVYESVADDDTFGWQDDELSGTEDPVEGDWEQGVRADTSEAGTYETSEALMIQDGNLRLACEVSMETTASGPELESVANDIMSGLAK